MVRYTEFYGLHANQGAIVDASAVELVVSNLAWLRRPLSMNEAMNLSEVLLRPNWKRHRQALSILLEWAMLEVVAVDSLALLSKFPSDPPDFKFLEPLGDLLALTEVPGPLYLQVQAQIDQTLKRIRAPSEIAWLKEWMDFTELEEPYVESSLRRASQQSDARLPTTMTGSGDRVSRVLAYLGIASAANAPVLLSPVKRTLFENLNSLLAWRVSNALGTEVFQRVLAILEDKVTSPIRHEAEELLTVRNLSVPALEEAVLFRAGAEHMSLLDAVLALRADDGAREFRHWLWHLQAQVMSPHALDVARASRALKAFESTVETWGAKLDTQEGVAYRHRTLSLKGIPSVGFLFELLGGLDVRDPILNPKKHLTYVASWFPTARNDDEPTRGTRHSGWRYY